MKRLLSIILALALICGLAACGGEDSGSSGGGSRTTTPRNTGGGNDYTPDDNYGDIDWDAADDAMDALDRWTAAQGWSSNDYHNYAYGVWDSDVLPDVVPKQIDGTKPDQTIYKEKWQESFSSYGVGNMSFPDKNYESYGVTFYATEAQLAEFISAVEAKGFFGGQTEDSEWNPEWEWVTDEWYAYMRTYNTSEDGYDVGVDFLVARINQNRHPATFQGTKLPQIGAVMWSLEEPTGNGWENDDSVYEFWYALEDRGDLPEHWTVFFSYFGVTREQGKAYAQQMASDGWEIIYENEEEGWTGELHYSAQLQKGDIYAAVLAPGDGLFTLDVRFATMSESLYY